MTFPCGHTDHVDNTVRLNPFTKVCRECFAASPAKAANIRARVERNAAIRESFHAGTGRADLAAQYGLSVDQLAKIIGVANIMVAEMAIRNGAIIRRQRAGETLADLAAAFGLTEKRVKVITNGKDARPPCPTIARNAEIVRRVLAGENKKSLAFEYGLTANYVAQIVRRERLVNADDGFADRALAVAADLAGAKVAQLISDWRAPRILVQARWATMAALAKRGMSTPQIGKRVGGRDHSTVIYGLQQAEYLASRSADFADLCARVDAA